METAVLWLAGVILAGVVGWLVWRVGLRPQFPEAHNNYALLLESLGRKEEAAQHRREAERLGLKGP